MIGKIELNERARTWGLTDAVVEKDYVIGWILWGIGADPGLSASWIFKGGTCLKKCWLDTHRFSEDLDFTVTPGGRFEEGQVMPSLAIILDSVSEQSGLDFKVRTSKYKAVRPGESAEIRIYYRGPRLAGQEAGIKLDLNAREIVVLESRPRFIHHGYSDTLPLPAQIRSYAFEEVFAEKIRAMGERGRPRDLYDIVSLFRRTDLRPDPTTVRSVLARKCAHKGVPIPSLAALDSSGRRAEIEAEWENMLEHQLPDLAPCATFWSDLSLLFTWLEGAG